MKNTLKIKKSSQLNNLLEQFSNLLVSNNEYNKFKTIMFKISDKFFESDFCQIETTTNYLNFLLKKSIKKKKPIYMVSSNKYTFAFFIGTISDIKKILNDEIRKKTINEKLKQTLKTINSCDAAILAYLALLPKPVKDYSALSLLSSKNVNLGKCILNLKGKYSKEEKEYANIYKEWSIYKLNGSSKRKNLDIQNIIN